MAAIRFLFSQHRAITISHTQSVSWIALCLLVWELLLVADVAAVATKTQYTPSQTGSSDTTLTETISPSHATLMRSMSESESEVRSASRTWTDTASPTASETPSSSVNSVPKTGSETTTGTLSEDKGSLTTTESDVITASSTFNMTGTVSTTMSVAPSATFSSSETQQSTHSLGITDTLTQTMTFTESLAVSPSLVISDSVSGFTATRDRSMTRTRSATPTIVLTVEATFSISVSHNTHSLSPAKTRSPGTASTSGSELVTASVTKSATRNRRRRQSHSKSSNMTISVTPTVTADPTSSLVTLSFTRTVRSLTSDVTFSDSVTQSLSFSRKPLLRRRTGSWSVSMSNTVVLNTVDPTVDVSQSETFTQPRTQSASPSVSGMSPSIQISTTITEANQVTTSVTPSRTAGTLTKSGFTISSMRTMSVTRSKTPESLQLSKTITSTATLSSQKSKTLDTYTATLTMSRQADSNTRHKTPSTSLSFSANTVTIEASETRTVTQTFTNTTTHSRSRTEERTATESVTADVTMGTRSMSPSDLRGSRSLSTSDSLTLTPSPDSTVSSSYDAGNSSTRFFTFSPDNVSQTSSMSLSADVVTMSESVSLGSATRSFPVRRALADALRLAVQSVLFPSLAGSSAPCISLSLYLTLPLFLIFLFQLLLLLVSRTLEWKVNVDTHRNVRPLRSLVIVSTYLGLVWPCHLRCAYAHTLRGMVQLLVLQLVLAALVDQVAPASTSTAAFCAALAIVISQIAKPLTHLPYGYYRYPKDEELSARMHLAQMKRILRLRRKEELAAKHAERERRRAEGLDDASTTTEEDPEFAYDLDNVVAFDYLDTNVSLSRLRYGADLDVEFPDEGDVFGGKGVDKLMDVESVSQTVGPGYVDVTFPGDEGVRIIDLFSDKRVSLTSGGQEGDSSGRGLTSAGGSRSTYSSSFVRTIPATERRPKGKKHAAQQAKNDVLAAAASAEKKGNKYDEDNSRGHAASPSLSVVSLGSLASFHSPTRAALAVAESDGASSIATSKSRTKGRKKKKRIGPGKDGVVVIPDFDDDFGVRDEDIVSVEDEAFEDMGPEKTPKHSKKKKKHGDVATASQTSSHFNNLQLALADFSNGVHSSDEDDVDDEDDKASKVSSSVRYRLEMQPIVTYHLPTTLVLLVAAGVLLFSVDRFRDVCHEGFLGNFGGLWGVTVVLDATVGDALLCAAVYLYRRLMAGGEEGDRVAAFLHPYNGEQRDRMYEHLSRRFLDDDGM